MKIRDYRIVLNNKQRCQAHICRSREAGSLQANVSGNLHAGGEEPTKIFPNVLAERHSAQPEQAQLVSTQGTDELRSTTR